MKKRFVSIWFRHLLTDYFTLRQPGLHDVPFVLTTSSHGRTITTASNALAESQGIFPGAALADARAIVPALQHHDEPPDLSIKLLQRIAAWCIRFTPIAAIDPPSGILLDVTGCSHLWGGDSNYVTTIAQKFKDKGYDVRIAIAGTIGTAWALARYSKQSLIAENGEELQAIISLPPAALRLEPEVQELLYKLGLHQIGQFVQMPRDSLQRRFGSAFLLRLDQALGNADELIEPVSPPEPYSERLPCLEPIATATGIEIALDRLLNELCKRLEREGKGLRAAKFTGYRIDGKIQTIDITTKHPSNNPRHLYKLFEQKIDTIEPALGIELFVLDALKVEEHLPFQSALWHTKKGIADVRVAELIDQLSVRLGDEAIHRYLPAEHHWPERSVSRSVSLNDKAGNWPDDKLRPVWIQKPEKIQVTAPVPDYPPMNFRYKGKLHSVKKADGPERIEPEWWLQNGEHRDYYIVEDEKANRYWIFRLGHYDADEPAEWFLHGYFA
jgi:protein ImuB